MIINKQIFFVFFAFFILHFSALAQTEQKGVVIEISEDGQKVPLPNVEVVAANAGSTVTNEKGEFSLSFRTLKPGDRITFRRIEKAGYEVLNPDILTNLFVSRQEDQIVIIMVKSDVLRDRRSNYLSKAREKVNIEKISEEKTLKSFLSKGLITQENYQKKLVELKNFYEDQLERIDSYLDRIVRIDPFDVSEQEKEVLELAQQGDFENAIAKYEEMNLIEAYKEQQSSMQKLQQSKDKIHEARKEKQENLGQLVTQIHRQIDLLYVAGGKENITKAEQMLKSIADSDPTQASLQYDYAKTEFHQNHLDEAMTYVNRGFDATDRTDTITALLHVLKGEIYSKKDMMNESLTELFAGLGILNAIRDRREVAHPVLSERATTHASIAQNYARMNNIDEAMRYFGFADEQWAILMREDSAAHVRPYSDMLVDYGRVLMLARNTVLAENYLNKAVVLTKQIAETSPGRYSGKLAAAYNNLGYYYRTQKNYPLSTEYLQKAEKTYLQAVNVNPETYYGPLLDCYMELSLLNSLRGNYDDAMAYVDKGFNVVNTQLRQQPRLYQERLARLKTIKATAYWYNNEYRKSLDAYIDSAEEYQKLYKQSPDIYHHNLAHLWLYVGICYEKLGDMEQAMASYQKSVEVDPIQEALDKIMEIQGYK